jgi:hypothetical protein
MAVPDQSRRAFVRRGAYVAPAVLTLAAAPAFSKSGSAKEIPGKRDKPEQSGKKR